MKRKHPAIRINDKDLVVVTLHLFGFNSYDLQALGFPFQQAKEQLLEWQGTCKLEQPTRGQGKRQNKSAKQLHFPSYAFPR